MYFFAEGPEAGDGPPTGFQMLSKLLPNATFVNDCNASDTLFHFGHADMVISLGSSFSLLTPLLSPKPVVFSTPPKEGNHIDFYDTSDTVQLDAAGNVAGRTLDEVRALIIDKCDVYCDFHLHVPPRDKRGSSARSIT